MMVPIQTFVDPLKIGGKQVYRNMTVFSLLASDFGEPDYLILEEALGQGVVEITEISHGGSVPDLKLINKSSQKILIVDGEELIGAKQNRIVNASFLIAPQTEIRIPVSCVEEGRWAYRSPRFSYGKKVMPPSMRREHQRFVELSLKKGMGYRSNQSMIWEELALKSDRMGVHSETKAMADLFDGQRDRLGEYLKAFRPVECQVGALFAINGKIVGLECFGHQQTMGKFSQKLIQSYALDAVDWLEEAKEEEVKAEKARNFLEGFRDITGKACPSLGLGENVRFEGRLIFGAALVHEGRVLHLSAFVGNGQKNDGAQVRNPCHPPIFKEPFRWVEGKLSTSLIESCRASVWGDA